MANFPRSDYLLPGYKSLADAFRIAFISLFFSPTDIAPLSNAVLRNAQWALDRHELEYGVTIVPLAIVLGGFVLGLSGVLARRTTLRVTPKQVGVLALIGVILFVPLALNTYTPEWNALLKRTPLLKSASTFVRWFCVYIPFLAVLSALIMQRWAPRIHAPLAVIGLAVVIVLNVVQDRSWYAGGAIYPPAPVLAAYRAVKAGNPPPPIRDIGVSVDRNGQVVLALNRNDALIEGVSQLYCYNPIFGYRLENLPVGDLHPGPVTDVEAGHYNIKNPACYVFPEENGCVPGDHFRLDQRAAMEDFVSYRQFPFKMSRTQAVANVVTQLGLLLSLVLLVATAGVYLAGRLSGREQAGGSR